MSTALYSSGILRRLRGPAVLGLSVVSLAACTDSNGNDISGPSRDCIEALNLGDVPSDEDDVESISLNGSESGSLSNGDIEDDEGFFADAYILELNADTDIEISLNPSGFDAVLIIFGEDNPEPDIADSEDPEATEEIAGSAAEGCYLIVVTSFEAEETGSYSLSVDEID